MSSSRDFFWQVRWPPESSHSYIKHLVVIQIERRVTTESSGRRRLRNILSGSLVIVTS
jgi:hypothetical protein